MKQIDLLPLYDKTVKALCSGFDVTTGKPKKGTKWPCLDDFIASMREACKHEGDLCDAQTMRGIRLADSCLDKPWGHKGNINWKWVNDKIEADRKMYAEWEEERIERDKKAQEEKASESFFETDKDGILIGESSIRRVWSKNNKKWLFVIEGKDKRIILGANNKGDMYAICTGADKTKGEVLL